MASLILTLSFSALLAFLSWHILAIYSNYQRARLIGLPIIITPVHFMNPVWALGQAYFVPLLKRLPFNLGDFVHYTTVGWIYVAKHAMHDRLGDAFTIVGPGETQVIVANAAAIADILTRRKDFQKPEAMYKPLEIFGPNLDTVEGDTWQRHRRITTPPFNERNSGLVWRESLAQAQDMLQSWISASSSSSSGGGGGGDGITSTDSDSMTLALHVLTAAGFGKSYPFVGGLSCKPAASHSMAYKDALRLILRNIILTIIISSVPIPAWMLGRKVRSVNAAVAEFKVYMTEMVEAERSAVANGEEDKDNLMSVLVRAAELSKGDERGRNSLTDEEIYGNLFMYNLAGHESTANTLGYAVALLSTDRAVQDWIGEEIDAVFAPDEDVAAWQYETAFPQLKRCMALMYETLRLYGPVQFIPKYTNEASQMVAIDGREYTIPPKTYVVLNARALHTMPRYWGPDSMVWRPSRWITTSATGAGAAAAGLESEELFQPVPGSYVPFAQGPRVCPGKKFAQVEFTAVMACLFRRHRVEPVRLAGEKYGEAAQRILRTADDSDIDVTLKMKHPERIKLKWMEKEAMV